MSTCSMNSVFYFIINLIDWLKINVAKFNIYFKKKMQYIEHVDRRPLC